MLAIYVAYDSSLDAFERGCVHEAMRKFASEFPQRKVMIYGARSWSTGKFSNADWYIDNAKKLNNGLQVDAWSVINLLIMEPWQKGNPHIDIMLTARDLGREDLNYCFGMTAGRYTVQSVFRYRHLGVDDRRRAIEAVIWHELGHVFMCAGNPHRTHIVHDSYGKHCTNPGCVMQRVRNLPDLVRIARGVRQEIYCPQCLADIARSYD